MWTEKNIPDLTGKTAIVTGANTGIGYETAKALFKAGADVTIASRDKDKALSAVKKIASEISAPGLLEAGVLDLSNLEKIKIFAENFKKDHHQLDILVNNAGVMVPPASMTDDGYELQFGVNFLGHFALTGHLFDLLNNTSESRIVNVSSGAATLATGIDFENIRLEKDYDEWREYAISKLSNVLFTYELDRRLKKIGSDIKSVASHPGVTSTELQRHIPSEVLPGMLAQYDILMEPWQGALPSLFAATDPSVKGGDFIGPDGDKEYSGYPALSQYSTETLKDDQLANKLYDFAEKETKVQFP